MFKITGPVDNTRKGMTKKVHGVLLKPHTGMRKISCSKYFQSIKTFGGDIAITIKYLFETTSFFS